MIAGVTRHMLPHLSRVPHLRVNRPLGTSPDKGMQLKKIKGNENCCCEVENDGKEISNEA